MTDTFSPNDRPGTPLTWALLDRYLTGECTPAEAAEVRRVVERTPDGVALLQELRAGVGPDEVQRLDVATRLDGLRVVLGGEEVRVGASREIGRRVTLQGERLERGFSGDRTLPKGLGMQTGRGAQSRGATRGATGFLRRFLWSVGTTVVIALAVIFVAHKTPRQSETTRTYVTQSGRQATFELSDGTRVTLAPRTTLRLVRFGSLSRAVELDGQAYFEVTQSARTPFLVKTGVITTQVLGTSFLVRHYANDGLVHIAVAEGRVGVRSMTPTHWSVASPVILTAGHVGDITDSTVHENAVADLGSETDWLHGQLMFRHAAVRDVLRTLSRWYGYQFRCVDSTLMQESVTLAVNAQSSTEALSTLERILSVHLTVVGDTVTLTPHAKQSEGTEPGTRRQREYDVWIPTREVGR